jgi:hypothetical protein
MVLLEYFSHDAVGTTGLLHAGADVLLLFIPVGAAGGTPECGRTGAVSPVRTHRAQLSFRLGDHGSHRLSLIKYNLLVFLWTVSDGVENGRLIFICLNILTLRSTSLLSILIFCLSCYLIYLHLHIKTYIKFIILILK